MPNFKARYISQSANPMQKPYFIYFISCLLFCTISIHLYAGEGYRKKQNIQVYSIHGNIKSQSTGELLIGVTVSVLNHQEGITSNEYGFYSLSMPAGKYTILVSAIGMKPKQKSILLDKDLRLDISLEEEMTSLEEVRIVARTTDRSLKNPQMGVEKINVQETRNMLTNMSL